jgi:hypothetical protein
MLKTYVLSAKYNFMPIKILSNAMQLMCFDSKMVAVPCLLIFFMNGSKSHCYCHGRKKYCMLIFYYNNNNSNTLFCRFKYCRIRLNVSRQKIVTLARAYPKILISLQISALYNMSM